MGENMAASIVASLQSRDHKALMDTIDRLRSKGISRYVDLPQIVVCGDQSSGKSSVLQAVSGMSFPIKDNLCTRFATELILRHVPGNAETCKISIQAGNDRSEEERAYLAKFQQTALPHEVDIGHLIEQAKVQMGLGEQSRTFSSDVLRIEVTGPAQPNLTIVDLPGLFLAGNKDQSAEDANTVRGLVRSYMVKSLSIILAVVSAKNDFALQEVTQMARKIDPHGLRTIGLITKPDTLDVGSDSERAYLELAQNRDVHFRLGWHVLRNRDFKSRDTTNEERDKAEELFLGQGVWVALPRKQKGVASLRTRLSEVLTDQILGKLSELCQNVETELNESSLALEKLGTSRNTVPEQRSYLLRASYHFATLVRESISGLYSDYFFGSARDPEGGKRRLRAVVQNTLTDLAETMRLDGHARRIVDHHSEGGSREVLRQDYLEEVKKLMRRSRGCELPGTYNPLVIHDMFQEQSEPWRGHLARYSQRILEAVNHVIDSVLSHVVDHKTRAELWQELVSPELDDLKNALNNKVAEILASHTSRHPITYNHYLTENVQKTQKRRDREKLRVRLEKHSQNGEFYAWSVDALLNILEPDTEPDMEIFASSAATDVMEAYYKVALKRAVDDFSDLAVEACLISKLPNLFSPEKVDSLADAKIERIAAEGEETTEERATLMEKKAVLSESLQELKRLVRNHHHLNPLAS
ncbi:P-loop containing nucleoside triphosphate hydrolase protein [Pestalotiopsis sp. NC0098]|nr:P-loop containing nucleoside triphosphate hydrolase protein [Pestalotiopsis sp. NC0098]